MLMIYDEYGPVPNDGSHTDGFGVTVRLFGREADDHHSLPHFILSMTADYVPDHARYEVITRGTAAEAQRQAMARFDELRKQALIGYHAEQAQSKMRIEELRERED